MKIRLNWTLRTSNLQHKIKFHLKSCSEVPCIAKCRPRFGAWTLQEAAVLLFIQDTLNCADKMMGGFCWAFIGRILQACLSAFLQDSLWKQYQDISFTQFYGDVCQESSLEMHFYMCYLRELTLFWGISFLLHSWYPSLSVEFLVSSCYNVPGTKQRNKTKVQQW